MELEDMLDMPEGIEEENQEKGKPEGDGDNKIDENRRYICTEFSCTNKLEENIIDGIDIIENEGRCPECNMSNTLQEYIVPKGKSRSKGSIVLISFLVLLLVGGVAVGVMKFLKTKDDIKTAGTIIGEGIDLIDEVIQKKDSLDIDEIEPVIEGDEVDLPKKDESEIEEDKENEIIPAPPSTPLARDGVVKLSYGSYTGELKNGKPHGMGEMVYSKRSLISKRDLKKRYAESGQSIRGSFKNGDLVMGKLYSKSGSLLEIISVGR